MKDMGDKICIFMFVTAVISLTFAVVLSGVAILNRIVFPGQQAAIEQLRQDLRGLSPEQSEDAIGQAVIFNQKISAARRYNKNWWSDAFISDQWNGIEMLQIPKNSEQKN